jgi:hypothetical protein
MSKSPRFQRGLRMIVEEVISFDHPRLLGLKRSHHMREQDHRRWIACGVHCAKEFLPRFNPMLIKPSWSSEGELGRMTPGLRASYVTRDETVHDLRDLDWLETLRLVQNREWEDAHAHMRVDLFPPPASLKLSWAAAGHQLSLRDLASDVPLERKIMEAGEDVCRRLATQAYRSGKSVALGGAMHEAFSTANWYRNHLPMFHLRPYQQPLMDYFAGKKS